MIKLVQLNEDLEHLSDELKDRVEVALNDTEAQVALETDEKKEEVKKDNKVAVDATNELAKETNADGKSSEIFESLNEDVIMDGEEVAEPLEKPEDFGVASAIADLIKRSWENIDQLNSYLATFESAPDSLKTALNSIVEDNMIHVGLLENALKEVDPKAENL